MHSKNEVADHYKQNITGHMYWISNIMDGLNIQCQFRLWAGGHVVTQIQVTNSPLLPQNSSVTKRTTILFKILRGEHPWREWAIFFPRVCYSCAFLFHVFILLLFLQQNRLLSNCFLISNICSENLKTFCSQTLV